MPKKVGTLISELFGLVGIDATQPEFKDIIALAPEVDDVTAKKISDNILTIEAAKMNGTLKSHFKAQTLNGVDAQHKELATEYGLSADEIAELEAIKDTFERNKKLVAKVKENTAKLNAGTGDKTALVEENKRLNKQILDIKTANDAKIAEIQKNTDNQITDYAVTSYLRSLKYANENVGADVNSLTAKNLLQAAFAEKKALLKRGSDNSLRLFNAEHPDLDYQENNKPVAFADFASKILQEKNMLFVSDPKKPAAGKTGAGKSAPEKETVEVDNSETTSFYDQQLKSFEEN